MPDAEPDPGVCDAALTLAFSVLGKRWNGMILGVLGAADRSFAELRRAVPNISDTVLSDRLSELAGIDLVVRDVEPGPPVSVRYRLTPRGASLVPLLDDLAQWASANLVAGRPSKPAAAEPAR
jgi:DNA-binding HxlR family transcriptional regulator